MKRHRELLRGQRMKSNQMFPGYGGASVAVNASAMYNIPIPNIETDI